MDFSRQIEQAAASVGAEAETITSTSAGRGLHELAEELAADLIVIGSAHRGRVGQAVAGSVAMSLLHGSPCSVGVAPRGYSQGGERRITEIAVGVDGSDEARMALDEAVELARAGGVPIKLIAVAERPSVTYGKSGPAGGRALEEAIEETMRRQLGGATESVPGDVRVEPVLATGEPAATLAELARADGALLVLGSRSYGPLRRVLLGSVSAALALGALPADRAPSPRQGAGARPPACGRRERSVGGPVFLCYDGSAASAAALAAAGRLFAGREALVCHAWVGLSDAADRAAAEQVAAEGVRIAVTAGFRARPLPVREQRKAWRTLLAEADRARASVIVAGAHGRSGLARTILGSVSSALVHHSARPTLVVPGAPPAEPPDGALLLCYDGSASAKHALEAAAELCAPRDGLVFHFWESWVARAPRSPG